MCIALLFAGLIVTASPTIGLADAPCLVTLDRKQLFVAEPTQKLEALEIAIDGRAAPVTLPAGGDAGRSVVVAWPVE